MGNRLRPDAVGTLGATARKSRRGRIGLAALAGVMLMAAGVETARAGVVTQSDDFDIHLLGFNGTTALAFDLFNPSLGVLTGVSLSLSSDTVTTISISVTGTGSLTAFTANASNTASFSVAIEDPTLTALQTTETASVSCTSPDGVSCGGSAQVEVPFDGTYDIPSADLADFIGAGALTVDLNYSNSPACEPSNKYICGLDFELAWTSGTVELTYSYRAVPEPSTWVMMALGLAGLGGTGLRRRKPAPALP